MVLLFALRHGVSRRDLELGPISPFSHRLLYRRIQPRLNQPSLLIRWAGWMSKLTESQRDPSTERPNHLTNPD